MLYGQDFSELLSQRSFEQVLLTVRLLFVVITNQLILSLGDRVLKVNARSFILTKANTILVRLLLIE